MPDLAEQILPRLTSQTLPGLPLWPGAVLPHYGGYSIANMTASLAAWLGTPPFGTTPLAPELTDPLGPDVRRAVVLLMDSMGYLRFKEQLHEPGSPWARLSQAGVFGALTSVFPPTTVAALTSMWTGRPPGEHGVLAYELWLREYGAVVNMVKLSPMATDSRPELLAEAGFEPAKFLTVPTLGQHLEAAGIPFHAFLQFQLTESGLSKMLLAGAEIHGFFSPSDQWVNLREHLEATAGQRQLCWTYWPLVDTLAHHYGPATSRLTHEVNAYGQTMADAFLDLLNSAAREGTALIVLADHGQVLTPKLEAFELKNYPDLLDHLHILPTGEHRAAFLHCRPGQVAAARQYVEKTWPGHFQVVDQAAAIASGLYGKTLDRRTASRLGELLVLARNDAYWWWASEPNALLGRHGSLGAEEMLVPFLAARLDRM